MSDESDKKHPMHFIQHDVDDMEDATIELSLKDVFQIKKEDKKPVQAQSIAQSSNDALLQTNVMSAPSNFEDDGSFDELHTINTMDSMAILDGVELIPLDDEAITHTPITDTNSTSVLSSEDSLSILGSFNTDWDDIVSEVSEVDENPQTTVLTAGSFDERTSAYEIPDQLLAQLHLDDDDDMTLNAPIPQSWLNASKPPISETDQTRAISFADIEAAQKLSGHPKDQHVLSRTSEMPAQQPQPSVVIDQSQVLIPVASPRTQKLGAIESTVEEEEEEVLEFVAAVDQNNRLFVPLRLFEEGKLKPGMRILVRATILK